MPKKYTGVVLADMHVGAIPIEKLYGQFYHQIIKKKEMKTLDYIIICGDWFDHKLFLSDKESLYSYKMIQDMITATKETCKIRFIYGTESHECDQYDIIDSIKDRDIKVIKEVQDEWLYPELHVLYLPEEHVMDKEEYYKEYQKDKEYNYIFGHGIIREAMKMAAVSMEQNTSKRKKVPVFSTAYLRKLCKGQVYFGHYHIHTDMDDIYYVGSFTRWQFGEEDPKGYYIITYDVDKDKYKNRFMENIEADIYTTIRYGYSNPVFKSVESMEDKLQDIDSIMDRHMMDHVRFQFNIPQECENPEFIMNYIKERYRFRDKVKIGFDHGYVEKKREKEKEQIKEEADKYSFIFDPNMPFPDKVAHFIYIDYNREIEVKKVDRYLNQPLNELNRDSIKEQKGEEHNGNSECEKNNT